LWLKHKLASLGINALTNDDANGFGRIQRHWKWNALSEPRFSQAGEHIDLEFNVQHQKDNCY